MASANQLNLIELAPVNARTASLTGAAVDLQPYDGMAHIILQCETASAGTDPTLNVKLTHCATAGGSYEDVPEAAFDEVVEDSDVTSMISVQVGELERFVQIVGTIGGTSSPAFAFGVTMLASKMQGRNASQAIVTDTGS